MDVRQFKAVAFDPVLTFQHQGDEEGEYTEAGEDCHRLADSLFLENGVDGAGSVIASYGNKQAEIIYSKITDSKLPTQIQGENGCMVIEQCPIIKKITIYYRNGETEELQFDKRDNPMIYETKDLIRLIKEHKVDHQFLRASEIEMDITDEVRRQTGIVFPADKIREQ